MTTASARRSTKTEAEPQAPSGYEAVTPGQTALVNRWVETVNFDEPGALRIILEKTGHRLDGEARVVGFADPTNGVQVITATGAPPCRIKPGSYSMGHWDRTHPDRLVSDASSFSATPAQLLRLLFRESDTDLEKFLQQNFPGYRPRSTPFFAARDGGKEALEAVTEDAIRQVQRKDHGCTIELCRIDAIDRQAAAERLQAGNLPWRQVRTTKEGQVAELDWHGAGATLAEQSAYAVVERLDRESRQKQLERDVLEYAQRRRLELGL
jgi:hypothetical protein